MDMLVCSGLWLLTNCYCGRDLNTPVENFTIWRDEGNVEEFLMRSVLYIFVPTKLQTLYAHQFCFRSLLPSLEKGKAPAGAQSTLN